MLLFKYNQMKILFGLLIVTVVIVLGYLTWKLANDLLIFFNIPWDYISFYFFIYNFALVGLLQVLYKGPKWIQQLFLIVMSSLMAFSFSSLPSLVTWLLLALLVIWDLIAVLCPYGPLRLLIESSQSQEREIPALLYSGTFINSLLRIFNESCIKSLYG